MNLCGYVCIMPPNGVDTVALLHAWQVTNRDLNLIQEKKDEEKTIELRTSTGAMGWGRPIWKTKRFETIHMVKYIMARCINYRVMKKMFNLRADRG